MGTGSVTHLVFTRVFGLPTVPVPLFGRRLRFFPYFRPISARSQSPFSTDHLQFELIEYSLQETGQSIK